MCADMPTPLRPHHGLCMAYFVGYGYGGGFEANMARVIDSLKRDSEIVLTDGADVICAACPKCMGGVCADREKSDAYDRAALEICGFSAGDRLTFSEFTSRVEERIIEGGSRRRVCGGCQWESICDSTPSKWRNE